MRQYKYIALVLSSALILLGFFNRGFAYYDEGFILHAAQRVLQGGLPYRDFDLIYTPGTVFLTAAAFRILGESILTGRILALITSLLTGYLIFQVCQRATKNNLGSFLAVLLYLAWGPAHINFPWPSMLALTAGLLTIHILSKTLMGSLDSKKSSLGMTNVGFMTFATFLMKQNFGLAVFLSFILGLGLIRRLRQMRNFLNYLLGFVIGLLAFFIYLISTNSLSGFIDNFYFYTIKKIFLEGVAGSAFPTGIKGLLYLFPGLISLASIYIAYKRQRKYIFLPLFTFFFYLFGIRPTTDFVHLTTLMSLAGLPLVLLLQNTGKYKYLVYTSLLLIMGLGFYTALFKNYYRWDSPLVRQNYFIRDPRAKIFVDQKFNQIIPEIISEIKKNSTDNDYIFIFPNAPMFYFLTERKNPTRYLNLPLGLHTARQEREAVDDLRQSRVRIILTNETSRDWRYPLISDYILKNFRKKKEIFEFILWEKDESARRSAVQSK